MTDDVDDVNEKVKSLKEHKEKKEKKVRITQKEAKIPKAFFYREFADHIIRNGSGTKYMQIPDFDHKFHVVSYFGQKRFLEEMDRGLVRFVDEDYIIDTIIRFINVSGDMGEEFPTWLSSNVEEVFRFWKALSVPIEEPPLVREATEPGLCFHRIPFDCPPNGVKKQSDFPTISSFLKRMSNKFAFMLFIASLFDHKSSRQQYLWLHGQGMDGKGTLLRMLEKVFGPAFHSDDTKFIKDRFFSSAILNKRIVCFPDTNDAGFPGTQFFKSLTGDDPIRIEEKYRMPYTARLNCKFIFASNEKPDISPQTSDLRRIIYCEVETSKDGYSPTFEDKFMAEAPKFISYCRAIYTDLYKGQQYMINNASGVIESLLEETEGGEQLLLNKRFELCQEGRMTSVELAQVIKEEKMSNYEKMRFIKWMRSKYNIDYKNIKSNGSQTRFYVGIKVKPFHNFYSAINNQ